jgi:hypothetical protein
MLISRVSVLVKVDAAVVSRNAQSLQIRVRRHDEVNIRKRPDVRKSLALLMSRQKSPSTKQSGSVDLGNDFQRAKQKSRQSIQYSRYLPLHEPSLLGCFIM